MDIEVENLETMLVNLSRISENINNIVIDRKILSNAQFLSFIESVLNTNYKEMFKNENNKVAALIDKELDCVSYTIEAHLGEISRLEYEKLINKKNQEYQVIAEQHKIAMKELEKKK